MQQRNMNEAKTEQEYESQPLKNFAMLFYVSLADRIFLDFTGFIERQIQEVTTFQWDIIIGTSCTCFATAPPTSASCALRNPTRARASSTRMNASCARLERLVSDTYNLILPTKYALSLPDAARAPYPAYADHIRLCFVCHQPQIIDIIYVISIR